MNKFLTKIATAFVGMTMAIGVGVAAASNQKVREARATDTSAIDFSQSANQVYDTEKTLTHAKWKIVKNSSSTNPKYYEKSPKGYRMYAKSFFYIEADSGYKISSVTLTYATSSFTGKAFAGDSTVTSTSATATSTIPSSGNSVTPNTKIYEVMNAGSSGNIAWQSVSVNIDPVNDDPVVSISDGVSSARMLNKDGSAKTISGISATASHLTTNSPYFIWSITPTNCNASLVEDSKLHTSEPTITVSSIADSSKDASFSVGVSVYENSSDETPAATASTEVVVNVKPFGGTISWTPRTITFNAEQGFDFSSAPFTTTMYDGTDVDYENYNNLHIYEGSTELTLSNVTESYCSTNHTLKMTDTENNAVSSSYSTTITWKAKATATLTANGGIDTIQPNQVLYLKCTPDSGWGNELVDTNPYVSGNTAVATVNDNGKVTGVSAGDAIITATLKSGKTAAFTVHVAAEVIYTPEQMSKMITENSISSGNYYDGVGTQTTYKVRGYFRTISNKYYACSDMNNTPAYKVQLYKKDMSLSYSDGGIVVAHGALQNFSGSVELNSVTIDSYLDPYIESFSITGNNEVYKGQNLTLGTGSFVPSSGAAQTVAWSVDDTTNASITSAGVFRATASGTYTVTATSTTTKPDETHAEATKTIKVYEFKSAEFTLIDNPKTKYFVGDTAEDLIASVDVSYKCGENDYTPTTAPTVTYTSAYSYNSKALTNAIFGTVGPNGGATLAVSGVALTLKVSTTTVDEKNLTPGGLSVNNVEVCAVELDAEATTITVTNAGEDGIERVGFGASFVPTGTVNLVYKNDYEAETTSLPFSSEKVTVQQPNTKQLGYQELSVTIDDSEVSGASSVILSAKYKIFVTNTINTKSNGELTVDPASTYLDNTTSKTTFSSYAARSNFTIADSNGNNILFTMVDTSKKIGPQTVSSKNYLQIQAGGSFYNSNALSNLSKITVTAYGDGGQVADNLEIGIDIYLSTSNTSWPSTADATVDKTGTSNKVVINEASIGNASYVKLSFTKATKFVVEFEMKKDTFADNEQATAMKNYLAQFKTCQSGWESREDVETLVDEYNAMSVAAKTAFADLTLTDYDWEKDTEYNMDTHEYVEDAVATKAGVNALKKLETMVDIYNKTLEGEEEALTLALPGDQNFTTFNAPTTLEIVTVESSSGIILLLIVSFLGVTAVAGYFLIKRRKEN